MNKCFKDFIPFVIRNFRSGSRRRADGQVGDEHIHLAGVCYNPSGFFGVHQGSDVRDDLSALGR